VPNRLPSIAYDPPGQPSLFDLWEAGEPAHLQPPLAFSDTKYRSKITSVLEHQRSAGRRLVSVGAGNGVLEAALAAAGWDVLATDPAVSALRLCRARGLPTRRFELLRDAPIDRFDVIYCDGVMGHLWDSKFASIPAWIALWQLGHRDSICCVSNDLSDTEEVEFAVRGSSTAAFYRPPPGSYGRDATSSLRWSVVSEHIYDYLRTGVQRKREIVVARLLADERVEPEDIL
jgi:SAM-dependent methyltransferase